MRKILTTGLCSLMCCIAFPQQPTSFPAFPPADVTTETDYYQMLNQLGITIPTLPETDNDPNRPASLVPVPGKPGKWQAPEGGERNRSPWGLWTNYDDAETGFFPGPDSARVGKYTPISLVNAPDGRKVTSGEAWDKTVRPVITEAIQQELYGRMPEKKDSPQVVFTKTDYVAPQGPTGMGFGMGMGMGRPQAAGQEAPPAYPSKMYTITGEVDCSGYPEVRNKPVISATLRLPAEVTKPVPVMIVIGWSFMSETYWQMAAPHGWGICMFDPNTVQPDNGAGLTSYLIGLINKGNWRKPDDIGSIGAWAWGISRLIDFLETIPEVNSKAIGLSGHSRYGKATLFTAAFEPRIAIAFPSDAGSLGTKLNRRHWGQDLEMSAVPSEYHWMAGNFFKFCGPLTPGQYLPRNIEKATVDAHSLLALCAPRPVFINGGTTSQWSDPYGMFLTARDASPVYELKGVKGLVMDDPKPVVDKAYIEGNIGFRYHEGGHTDTPDWPSFFEFAKKHLGL
ncbi:MAG: hypothetical protein IJS25_01005 [Bacteroidales bacterium]|nr:hypothetical protein [Bacteroidales bacterium]